MSTLPAPRTPSPKHGPPAAIARLRRLLAAAGWAGLALLMVLPPTAGQASTFGSSSYGSSSTNSSSLNSSLNNDLSNSSSSSSSSSSRRRRNRDSDSSSSSSDDDSSYAERRRKKREESKRKKNKSDKTDKDDKKGEDNAGDPSRARATDKTSVVKRNAKSEGKGGKEGGGTTEGLAEIKISPETYKENALYFDPSFAFIEAGDQFSTPLRYYNGLDQPVRDLDVWVQYDPAMVEPTWIDTKDLGTTGSATTECWPEAGYVHIKANLPHEITLRKTPLGTLHWRARQAVGQTKVRLAAPPGEEVALRTADGTNSIATNKLGSQSVVHFAVSIGPQQESEPGLRLVDRERALLPNPPQGLQERVRLVLRAPEHPLAEGEMGTADLLLLNPENLQLDQVDVRISYDPTAIKILDADENNYIRTGLNIFDGDFHEAFPFDLQLANDVDPQTGSIVYRMGSATGPRVYHSGVMARIAFRMLRPAGATPLRFVLRDPETGHRATDVSTMGRSLLGDTLDIAQTAMHGTLLQAAPRAAQEPALSALPTDHANTPAASAGQGS